MRRTVLFAAVFAAIFSGCGGSRSTANTSSNKSSGLYDTSSGTDSGNGSSRNTSQGDLPDQTRLGGGGGREEQRRDTSSPVSLNQAEKSSEPVVPTDRKIIRNAELDVETETPEAAQQRVSAIAESKGGFVVESQQSTSGVTSTTRDLVTMTVRVPAEKFAETLSEIRTASGRVIVETIKGQDVTEEFVDIQARLKAKKSLEAQFLEILKRANTVEAALDVQRELADVRGEIERVEGRLRFLENQSILSTIKIRLQTPRAFAAGSRGFGGRFADALSTGFDAALDFILGLVTLLIAVLPFALLIGLPSVLVFRYFWKRAARRRTAAEIAEDELKIV